MHFIAGLMEHKVNFVAAAFGRDCGNFKLRIYASLAEQERKMISEGIAALLALTGTYAELAVLNALAIAALYAASCAAVWALSRREAQDRRSRSAILLSAAGLLGIASMLLVIALASWSEIIGLCATIFVATLGYWYAD